ncbi:MAG: GNAT family N-acetyltransferase [Spirochaetes bacterium]|nr:GNAT family N-acetyltransferase [Spirochaetota bacterium]
MNNTAIRECRLEDVDGAVAIYREFVSYHAAIDPVFIKVPESPLLFSEYLTMNIKNESAHVLVAVTASAVTGFCIGKMMIKTPVYPDPVYGEIDSIAVLQSHQRHGIGGALFTEMASWFERKRVSRIELNVAVGNEKSSCFWRKAGFRPYMEVLYRDVPHGRHVLQ